MRFSHFFEVLQVPVAPTSEDALRRVYLVKARVVHPDKCGHPEAKSAFQRLQAAFECLSSPDSQLQHLDLASAMHRTGSRGAGHTRKASRRSRAAPASGRTGGDGNDGDDGSDGDSYLEKLRRRLQREMAEYTARRALRAAALDQRERLRLDALRGAALAEPALSRAEVRTSAWHSWRVSVGVAAVPSTDSSADGTSAPSGGASTQCTAQKRARPGPADEVAVGSGGGGGGEAIAPTASDSLPFQCRLCVRGFTTAAKLQQHLHASQLHQRNLAAQKRQRTSPSAEQGVDVGGGDATA